MKKIYYEEILNNISFQSLPAEWRNFDFLHFSDSKKLFTHQTQALENFTKILYLYYSDDELTTNVERNEKLREELLKYGVDISSLDIQKYQRPIDETRERVSDDFSLLNEFYPAESNDSGKTVISIENFINRAAFWMATGSGKTYVIIKAIELIDYLQRKKLIPEKKLLLILPSPEVIRQFQRDIDEFNLGRDRPIRVSTLKKYEEEENNWLAFDEINVYYSRLDLLSNERKENEIDFKDYENNGNWYVFLDEAHIGEKGNSKRQDYVSIMSRSGFLFNFSATFADNIDFITTAYNFNLKKLITSNYGKNIYLCDSNFKFDNQKDELSNQEKQKQILKSLIIFSVIDQEKVTEYYHHPLMVTLVNTVNTDDSDLLMFFKKLEEVATNTVDRELFLEAIEELKNDFTNDQYVFNSSRLDTNYLKQRLREISVEEILLSVFNSNTHGRIEIINGEEGKELALKLETSDSPFALIRIGDSSKFAKESLGENYVITDRYVNTSYFEELNNRDEIKVLIGSRSFYQGWDTNRPNVMNFINIGTKNAERYVLQSIGRGIRIEPEKGIRKRKDQSDPEKNQLLETLFIFATDKKGVTSVLDTLEGQETDDTPFIYDLDRDLFRVRNEGIPLLVPKYKKNKNGDIRKYGKFNINDSAFNLLKSYFNAFSKNLFIIKYNITEDTYKILENSINNDYNSLFVKNEQLNYQNIGNLMLKIISHISVGQQRLDRIDTIDSNDIRHYRHISLINLKQTEIKQLIKEIRKVAMYPKNSLDSYLESFRKGEIDDDALQHIIEEKNYSSNKGTFQIDDDIEIVNLMEHYYAPLIYSNNEKVEHFKNIINVDSEVSFVKSLIEYLNENTIDNRWMFSKIVENFDNIFIPYFAKSENRYKNFYPDFIFWVQDFDDNYKIIFVDPKGTKHSDYIQKIEGFKDVFEKSDRSIDMEYNDKGTKMNVSFELKMVTDNINEVPSSLEDYWIQKDDFSFLD